MNSNVPTGAQILLDFIGGIEAPRGYGTIYANKQDKLPKPLTDMTLDEVQAAQGGWSKNHGSSAAGRYQFMKATLKGLISDLSLPGSSKFTPDLQDRLGYELLKRRGYVNFAAGTLPPRPFGNNLAKEWASLPVLQDIQGAHRAVARGETYYAGDKLNKVLTTPEAVEEVLLRAVNARIPAPPSAPIPPPPDIPAPAPSEPPKKRGFNWWIVAGALIAALLAFVAFVPIG